MTPIAAAPSIDSVTGNSSIPTHLPITNARMQTTKGPDMTLPTDELKRQAVCVLGNVTEVAFSNIEINRDPAPHVFRLDLPADVRVIELDDAWP